MRFSVAGTISEKQSLVDFAVRVQREICIRTGAFSPATTDEIKQAAEGYVQVKHLDAVKGLV